MNYFEVAGRVLVACTFIAIYFGASIIIARASLQFIKDSAGWEAKSDRAFFIGLLWPLTAVPVVALSALRQAGITGPD